MGYLCDTSKFTQNSPVDAFLPSDDKTHAERPQSAKADAGKPKLGLVPTQVIRDIAEVREYGTKKYGDPDNWKKVEVERYTDALYRHLLAFLDNPEGCDEESGIKHYKHIACNIAFICSLMHKNT